MAKLKNDSICSKTKSRAQDRSIGKVGYRPIRSYLAMALGETVLLIVLLTYLSRTFIALSLIGLWAAHLLSMWRKLRFEVTFLYTVKTGGHDWWTPVTQEIILGAIPLDHHLLHLRENRVTHLITLLEPFEQRPGLVTPLSETRLLQHGIKRTTIPTQDFSPVEATHIANCVGLLHDQSKAGNKTYVHCKAGRGRSATIVVAYLLRHGIDGQIFSSAREAYAYLKKIRPQINLNDGQIAALEEYKRLYF